MVSLPMTACGLFKNSFSQNVQRHLTSQDNRDFLITHSVFSISQQQAGATSAAPYYRKRQEVWQLRWWAPKLSQHNTQNFKLAMSEPSHRHVKGYRAAFGLVGS